MPVTRRALPPLALALALASCVGERERLVAPDIKLFIDARDVPPGAEVTGRVVATDGGSGVIAMSVRAVVGDSTYRDRWDLLATDSADFAFALRVPENAVPGTPIVITAGTINDQLLSDLVVDTAFVAQAP